MLLLSSMKGKLLNDGYLVPEVFPTPYFSYLHYSFFIFIIFKYFLHVGLIFETFFVIRMKWKVIGSCHFPHLKLLILLPGFPGCRNAHLVCSIRQLCVDFGRQESKEIPHKMNKTILNKNVQPSKQEHEETTYSYEKKPKHVLP